MPRQIGIAVGSRDAAEERHVGLRGARQQHQDRGQRREQDPLQDSQEQHRAQRDHRRVKIYPADAPHANHGGKIDQSSDRGKHDSRQHRLGEIFQEIREQRHELRLLGPRAARPVARQRPLGHLVEVEQVPGDPPDLRARALGAGRAIGAGKAAQEDRGTSGDNIDAAIVDEVIIKDRFRSAADIDAVDVHASLLST